MRASRTRRVGRRAISLTWMRPGIANTARSTGTTVLPPRGLEPRSTLRARALRLRARAPRVRRGGPRRPPSRRACGPRPACAQPAWRAPRCRLTPDRARGSLVWRRRVLGLEWELRWVSLAVDGAARPCPGRRRAAIGRASSSPRVGMATWTSARGARGPPQRPKEAEAEGTGTSVGRARPRHPAIAHMRGLRAQHGAGDGARMGRRLVR